MEQRASIIVLGVNDLHKPLDFYENKFGWEKFPSSNENIVFYSVKRSFIIPLSKEKLAEDAGISSNRSGFNNVSLAYNTRSEQEVDSLIEELRTSGVNIVKES